MGEARPLNLLNTVAWLISTCSHPHPFCLRLGDCALAPCILASCVYMERQRQETSRQAMERKSCVDNAQWVWNKQAYKWSKQRNIDMLVGRHQNPSTIDVHLY